MGVQGFFSLALLRKPAILRITPEGGNGGPALEGISPDTLQVTGYRANKPLAPL